MWSYGAQNNYVSTDPSYDPYAGGGSSTYVSTDPTYAAYGQPSTGGSSLGGLWSAAANGVAGYAASQAQSDAAAQQAKLSAQAKLELAQQQRQFQKDDRQYKQDSVSKWSKYFG